MYYDGTIEKINLTQISPILNLSGTIGDDDVTIEGATLVINGVTIDLTTVRELTIDGLDGADAFVLASLLATLEKLTLIGGLATIRCTGRTPRPSGT